MAAATSVFQALCKRYQRAWGEPLVCIWKQEFQRRGVPHFHLSTAPPFGMSTMVHPSTGQWIEVDFKRWLSLTWANIVNHPDPEERSKHELADPDVDYTEGIKLTDPRRMAVYSAKYGPGGAKEHQHRMPTNGCRPTSNALTVADHSTSLGRLPRLRP